MSNLLKMVIPKTWFEANHCQL